MPLYLVVSYGLSKAAELLLHHGADVNGTDCSVGYTNTTASAWLFLHCLLHVCPLNVCLLLPRHPCDQHHLNNKLVWSLQDGGEQFLVSNCLCYRLLLCRTGQLCLRHAQTCLGCKLGHQVSFAQLPGLVACMLTAASLSFC